MDHPKSESPQSDISSNCVASHLIVVGGAKQQILGGWVPFDDGHPPGVTHQGLPGFGEVLLKTKSWNVPNLHLCIK